MRHAIVVGAGFSGAVAARILAEAGYAVQVWEGREAVGGNCRDYVDDNGIIVQSYGAHLFHTDSPTVMAFLQRFADFYPYRHTVLGRVDGRLIPIPFNLQSLTGLFPAGKAAALREALLSAHGYGRRISLDSLTQSKEPALQELAEILFAKIYRPYSEKQWGRPLTELDASVAGRVPVLLADESAYFSSRFQCMPQGGFSPLFDRMLSHPAIRVTLACDGLRRLRPAEDALWLDGRPCSMPVIWTGRLDALFGYRYGELPYRSLRFDWQRLPLKQFQPVGVVNAPDAPGYTRTLEFKHFTAPRVQDVVGTTIAYEYPCACGRQDTPFYPVPNPENRGLYAWYAAEARRYVNLYPLGRLAQYRYCNMDEAVKGAMELVRQVLHGA
ncbi:MAG: UDP-galactopyranose mutase [Clostridiales bacterium]|nr:UDP-galactopyranose mutase [Clostridiales bacterium]